MKVARARVVRAGPTPLALQRSGSASTVLPPGRRVAQAEVQADVRAQELIAQAEAQAQELVDAAHRQAAQARLRVEAEARANAAAQVAAQAVALAAEQARAEQLHLQRTIDIAVVLAERLLGEALRADPERVTALARQALRETGGARRVTIVAHPDDAAALERTLHCLELPERSVAIEVDPQRARGCLRLETESGVLDGELGPQFERLALRLRASLSR